LTHQFREQAIPPRLAIGSNIAPAKRALGALGKKSQKETKK
jgi:hypothetical protein